MADAIVIGAGPNGLLVREGIRRFQGDNATFTVDFALSGPVPWASSSAHPGGGVHGACGANAARAALRRPFARA